MEFKTYLEQAWTDHGVEALKVSQSLPTALPLMTDESHLSDLAHLAHHVFGSHLGLWREGIDFLRILEKHSLASSDLTRSKLYASIQSLRLASSEEVDLAGASTSDQIQIFAMAAGALAEQLDPQRAKALLMKALELAGNRLQKEDPAARSLAVAGNNMASALGAKESLSAEQIELMILAAQTGRKFWEIAGTWLNQERAEYRLAMAYLKALDFKKALQHAKICLEICQKYSAPSIEIFFGYESIALIEKARGDQAEFDLARMKMKSVFTDLSPEDQKWCEKYLLAVTETTI